LHNPRCRKSRETLQILKDKNIDFEEILYLENTPSKIEMKNILALLGKSPQEIIRKGESIFKENFKGKVLSDDEWLDVLVQYPKLIERPIVYNKDKAVIGRPPENVLEIL
jgi:arsenate reductase